MNFIQKKWYPLSNELCDFMDSHTGFWGSKKGIISEEILYETLEECAGNLEYLDFSQKVTDMPIINYLVLKRLKKRLNIVRLPGAKGAGS